MDASALGGLPIWESVEAFVHAGLSQARSEELTLAAPFLLARNANPASNKPPVTIVSLWVLSTETNSIFGGFEHSLD